MSHNLIKNFKAIDQKRLLEALDVDKEGEGTNYVSFSFIIIKSEDKAQANEVVS